MAGLVPSDLAPTPQQRLCWRLIDRSVAEPHPATKGSAYAIIQADGTEARPLKESDHARPLTTIGSRGDVQPLVALARRLTGLDQEVRACAPPHFGRVDRIPRHPFRHRLDRSCWPRPRKRAPISSATHFRAEVSDGGRPARGGQSGSRRLRRHRGRQGVRRSHGGRADGNPLHLRRLLPNRSAFRDHPPPVYATLAVHPADGTIDHRRLWDRDVVRAATLGAHFSNRSGRQRGWPRSPTCEVTCSPTGRGWRPTRRWRPGRI